MFTLSLKYDQTKCLLYLWNMTKQNVYFISEIWPNKMFTLSRKYDQTKCLLYLGNMTKQNVYFINASEIWPFMHFMFPLSSIDDAESGIKHQKSNQINRWCLMCHRNFEDLFCMYMMSLVFCKKFYLF
jgi:hypothetical protein